MAADEGDGHVDIPTIKKGVRGVQAVKGVRVEDYFFDGWTALTALTTILKEAM